MPPSCVCSFRLSRSRRSCLTRSFATLSAVETTGQGFWDSLPSCFSAFLFPLFAHFALRGLNGFLLLQDGRHRNPLVIRQLGSFHYRCLRLFHDPLFRRTGFNQHIDCCGKRRVVLDGPRCNPRFSRHLVGGRQRTRFLGFVVLCHGILIAVIAAMRLLLIPIPRPPLICRPGKFGDGVDRAEKFFRSGSIPFFLTFTGFDRPVFRPFRRKFC